MPVRSCRVTTRGGHAVRGRGPGPRGDARQRVGRRDRSGIQRRQGVGCGRARRARGQADGFYEVAGESGRVATGGERPSRTRSILGMPVHDEVFS
jgi:hypothetical protein